MQYVVRNVMKKWLEWGQWGMPTVEKAMAFVLTEVAEAYRAMIAEGLLKETPPELVNIIIQVGDLTEGWLRRDSSFVRNNNNPGYVFDGNHAYLISEAIYRIKGQVVYRDPGNFKEELGDVLFMTLVAGEVYGIDVQDQVIDKLVKMNEKKYKKASENVR